MNMTLINRQGFPFQNLLFHSSFLNNRKSGIYRQQLQKNTDIVNGYKQTANCQCNVMRISSSSQSPHLPFQNFIPVLRTNVYPAVRTRPITGMSKLRVVSRVPSVTGKSVFYVIPWRIKRYAHTVFIVL
jgi:hypothetical protein